MTITRHQTAHIGNILCSAALSILRIKTDCIISSLVQTNSKLPVIAQGTTLCYAQDVTDLLNIKNSLL